MATSTYVFDNNDTLVKISNIFNTNVRTLVKLNPWLKNSKGKTYLKPKDAIVTQYLDENFFLESRQAYNLLLNSGVFTITLSTAPRNLKVEITYANGKTELVSLGYDNRFYNVKTGVYQEYLGKFDFRTLSFIISDYNYAKTISKMAISYNLVYIIIPVVGNGAASTEDYLLSLRDIIGLQYKTTINNFISETSNNNYTNYNISNLDRYVVDSTSGLINSGALTLTSADTANLDALGMSNVYFSSKIEAADLNKTELYRLMEIAIYSAGANTMDRSKFSGTLNKGAYATKTVNTVIGNPFYGKCIVKVGSTTLNMPCYPDSIEDGVNAEYSETNLLGRSEPFLIYNYTTGRKLSFTFNMHREMTESEDEIEKIVKVIESGVYPQYGSDIAPQKVDVKIGNQIYISGVMTNERTTWSGPIDKNTDKNGNAYDKYNLVSVNFTVVESTNNPKSASDIAKIGGYRQN